MTVTDSQISVRGVDPDPGDGSRRRRPPAGSVIAVVSVAIGVVLGAAFAGGPDPVGDPADATVAVVPEPAPLTTTTTTTPRRIDRLATRVPGLIDSLVMAVAAPDGLTEVLVWEAADREPTRRAIPGGQIEQDASGAWLYSLSLARFSEGDALWVGDGTRMDPLATDVTGAVWHPTEPGRLAWVYNTPAGPALVETRLTGLSRPVIRLVTTLETPQARPVWWNDRGVVVDEGGVLVVIDETGRRGPSLEATFAGGRLTAGAVVIADGTVQITTSSLVSVGPAPWPAGCSRVSFSSTEPFVAVVCGDVPILGVWEIDAQDVSQSVLVFESAGALSRDASPEWTPDGRFVVAGLLDQTMRPKVDLLFYDVSSGADRILTFNRWVTDFAFARS